MANIKISTQTSTATAPPKANYGDLWVGKDGSFYATNQNGDAIKMALKSEVMAVQTTANAALPRANFESYNTMSTVEHWTGRYDTDGKKIYAKTIRTGNVGSVPETAIAHNISNININGYFYLTARASVNSDGWYSTMVPSAKTDGNYLRQIGFGVVYPETITMWHNYGNRWVSYIIYFEYTCKDR